MAMMFYAVLRIGHYLKILDFVVRFVTIDMVHVFIWKQRTTKMIFHDNAMKFPYFPADSLDQIPFNKRRPRSVLEHGRIAIPIPSRVMLTAPPVSHNNLFTQRTVLHLCCVIALTLVGCQSNKVPRAAFSDASVKCDPATRKDCWSVTSAYVKEHANLLDRLIRTKAALAICQEK